MSLSNIHKSNAINLPVNAYYMNTLNSGTINSTTIVNSGNIQTATINGGTIPTGPTSTTYSDSASGPWAASQPITVTISLASGGPDQTLVFATVGAAISPASVNASITGPTIPVGYRPASNLSLPMMVLDDGQFYAGVFNVTTSGATFITVASASGLFSGVGETGYSTQTSTWTTNA
jgi:hypothetical protein